jgi:hypothetical protein
MPLNRLIDLIPNSDSAETFQNSEPSLAFNPLDPTQMVAGTFGSSGASYFKSTDGGATWSDYGTEPSEDKTIAWEQDGSAVLTASITSVQSFNPFSDTIQVFAGITANSNLGSAINTTSGLRQCDDQQLHAGSGRSGRHRRLRHHQCAGVRALCFDQRRRLRRAEPRRALAFDTGRHSWWAAEQLVQFSRVRVWPHRSTRCCCHP